MNNRLSKRKVGTRHFGPKVDITDPCYDKDVWCRINALEIKSGDYECVVWRSKRDYPRVRVIGIYLGGDIPLQIHMKKIGEIGVDAGIAGFFDDKPNYTDSQWEHFCKGFYGKNGKKDWLINEGGFCSNTGDGDGYYPVLAHYDEIGRIDCLEIRF